MFYTNYNSVVKGLYGGRTDNYPVKDNPGTGEVAWLLKCLLYKNKSLSSDPWHHVKAGCDGICL